MSEAIDSDAVCVRFRLTRAEYQSAIRRVCWGLWSYRAFAALAAIALVAGMLQIFLAGEDDPSPGVALVAVAIVWSAFFGWVLFLRPVVQYRRQPRLREEQTHCFSDDGVTVSVADAESQIKWTFFSRVVELHSLYLIRHQRVAANIIPKRAFGSGQDEMRFRQLAQQHVKTDFRPQPATA